MRKKAYVEGCMFLHSPSVAMSPTPGQIGKHAGHPSGVDQKFEQQEVLENLGLNAFSSAWG
eukprot:4115353-Karenia_brevis.AAC.1